MSSGLHPIVYPVRLIPLKPPRFPAFNWELVDQRGALIAWFMVEEDALLAAKLLNQESEKLCSGRWVSGSGGHRIHEPCQKRAAWWHPDDIYAYCQEHLPPSEIDSYLPVKLNG